MGSADKFNINDPNFNYPLAYIALRESVLTNGQEKGYKIVSEGNKDPIKHHHHFNLTFWPPDLGPQVYDHGRFFVTRAQLFVCDCGAKVIEEVRGLI